MTPILLLLYRLYRLVSGIWLWVRRRFTPAGLAVLAATVLAMGLGVDTDNNVVYQAFTLLLSLLLVAVLFAWPFRPRLSATRLLPRFGTAGSSIRYQVRVQNLGGERQTGLTLFDNLADSRPTFREWKAAQMDEERQTRSFRVSQQRRMNPFKTASVKNAPLAPVAPHQEVEVDLEVVPLKRGVLRFTGITFARPDPLGLFRALAKRPLPQTILILPRRYAVPPIALPGAMKYQEGGVAMASNVGQSEDFVSLRDYRHGDPLRHIHWRTWARVGKPVVKEFEDEFFVRHALVLDTFGDYLQVDVFEEAVSVAASFACTITTQESLLDLLFVGSQSFCFTAGRGLAHADQMLEILAAVQACRDQPFQTLEHLVIDHIGAVSGCVCVLVSWDEQRQRFVEKLLRLGIPLLVLVIVPPGQGALEPGPMQDQPGQFHTLAVGRIERGLAALK
jgi:uncharacterized protein (DUF58 family)